MAQQFASIDDYIRTFPGDVQLVLEELRRAILRAAPTAGETISYQIPTMTLDGKRLVHFAGWKQHVSVYPAPAGDDAFEREIAPYRSGRGTVKFPLRTASRTTLSNGSWDSSSSSGTASRRSRLPLRHDVAVPRDAWSSAELYEPFMGRWSRLLATAVVSWLDPPPGLRWSDVGCGTGALSEAVMAAAAPASLVGVDTSEAYVALAQTRVADSRAVFQVGSAEDLPLPHGSVDWVVSGLVLNFVPDAAAAMREMRRVLVAGGVAAVYVWDYGADGMQMLRRFWDTAIAENPAAAELDEGARFPLCREGALEQLMAEAGLVDVVSKPVVVPTTFRHFDDYWTPFLGGQGPGPGYLAALPEEAGERLRARLHASLPTEADGSIRLTARAWAVQGTSP